MANGLPITDPASGYDPATPYANRDPRLTATVFVNGMLWLNRAVQLYNGGVDRPGGSLQQTKTGYYMRKFIDPNPAIVDQNFKLRCGGSCVDKNMHSQHRVPSPLRFVA